MVLTIERKYDMQVAKAAKKGKQFIPGPNSPLLAEYNRRMGSLSVASKSRKPRRTRLEVQLGGVNKGFETAKRKIEKECERKRKLAEKIKVRAIKKVERAYRKK